MKIYVLFSCLLSLAAAQRVGFFNNGFSKVNVPLIGAGTNHDSIILFLNANNQQQEIRRPQHHHQLPPSPPAPSPNGHPQRLPAHGQPHANKNLFGKPTYNYDMYIPPPSQPQTTSLSSPRNPFFNAHTSPVHDDLATVVIPDKHQLQVLKEFKKHVHAKPHSRVPKPSPPPQLQKDHRLHQQPAHPSHLPPATESTKKPGLTVSVVSAPHAIRNEQQQPVAYIAFGQQVVSSSGNGPSAPNSRQQQTDNQVKQTQQPLRQNPPSNAKPQEYAPATSTLQQLSHQVHTGQQASGLTSLNNQHIRSPGQALQPPKQYIENNAQHHAVIHLSTPTSHATQQNVVPAGHIAVAYGSTGHSTNYQAQQIQNNANVHPQQLNTLQASVGAAHSTEHSSAPNTNYVAQKQQNYVTSQITFPSTSSSSNTNGYAVGAQTVPTQQNGQVSYLPTSHVSSVASSHTSQPSYVAAIQNTDGVYAPASQLAAGYTASQTGKDNEAQHNENGNYGTTVQDSVSSHAPQFQTANTGYESVQPGPAYIISTDSKPATPSEKVSVQQSYSHVQPVYVSQQQASETGYTSSVQTVYSPTSTQQGSYVTHSQNGQSYASSSETSKPSYSVNSSPRIPVSTGHEKYYEPSHPVESKPPSANEQTTYIYNKQKQPQSEILTYSTSVPQQKAYSYAASSNQQASPKYVTVSSSSSKAQPSTSSSNYAGHSAAGSQGPSSPIVTPGSTYSVATSTSYRTSSPADKYSGAHRYTSLAQQPAVSKGHEQDDEKEEEQDDDEEDATYKVVYVPLDVLKNILSNSVDLK